MDHKVRKGKFLRDQSIKVYSNDVASNGDKTSHQNGNIPPLIAMEYISKILKVLSKVNNRSSN